jgi:uracil phosphoribosyltransferase
MYKWQAFMISGFRRDVDEICALLGYYAASSRPLKMGPIRCPETSVNNYHMTPRNIPEEHRCELL